ncbi:hypothetical protein [Altericroceibacterium xinjiangense]|uniref:hypothetical protein n=1 Tax=Altericroceibacterium xinjiangense TaxID=762261 RepID=UPI000F7F5B7F|nr:hypothetical protein [Altericroceibacterium xinjiangense]
MSAEQRRAANALSFGDQQALEDAGSPYLRALACREAIASVVGRLQESGLVSEPQLALLDRARGIYASRVEAAGPQPEARPAESEGESNAEAAVDPAAAMGSKAQLAIACLQRLQ